MTESDGEFVRPKASVHVIVHGRVQGVGFRQFVARTAGSLKLGGWVRNLDDGTSVELVAEGDEQNVVRFLDQVESGPPGSLVREFEVEWITPRGLAEAFEIRH